MSELGLSAAHFSRAFPFHFVVDDDLRIVQVGATLSRLLDTDPVGHALSRFFTVEQPAHVTASYETFRDKPNSLFIFRSEDGVRLRGQLCVDETARRVFFLGSPWVGSAAEVRARGLGITDFALHDPILDFLFTLNALRTAVADADSNAKRLADTKNALLAVIFSLNHDLKAPLNTIVGFARAIEEDVEESVLDDVPMFTQRIQEQCHRLQDLVGNLLALTNHGDGGAPETIDFPALFSELRGLLTATKHPVELQFEIGHASRLVVNRTKLFHSLLNLVSNGIKYRDEAKPTQSVVVRTADSPKSDALTIVVQDNGVGMAADQLPKIFEMFYRCKGPAQAGSGMGLYLVKAHVQSMNGEISVESGPEGSAFTLQFPLVPPEAVAGDG